MGRKLTPEQQAAKKVVDDQNAARDAGIAEATAARDAEVAKRDQEIADRSGSKGVHSMQVLKVPCSARASPSHRGSYHSHLQDKDFY